MSVDRLGTNCEAHWDGMPRTATSTLTQLLNSDHVDDFLPSLCQTGDDAYLMAWSSCNAPI